MKEPRQTKYEDFTFIEELLLEQTTLLLADGVKADTLRQAFGKISAMLRGNEAVLEDILRKSDNFSDDGAGPYRIIPSFEFTSMTIQEFIESDSRTTEDEQIISEISSINHKHIRLPSPVNSQELLMQLGYLLRRSDGVIYYALQEVLFSRACSIAMHLMLSDNPNNSQHNISPACLIGPATQLLSYFAARGEPHHIKRLSRICMHLWSVYRFNRERMRKLEAAALVDASRVASMLAILDTKKGQPEDSLLKMLYPRGKPRNEISILTLCQRIGVVRKRTEKGKALIFICR